MKMLDLTQISAETAVQEAVAVLRSGGLIIFPTETTYGLGADATNPKAIDKLLAYKARRAGKALSLAVADQEMAEQYVELNDTARRLYREFLPGPVTVISLGKHRVAPGVESEQGTLGVRLPDYPLVREIARKLGRPMTATSANASNQKRPYAVADILATTSHKQQTFIDLVLDAGELPHNEPSTVIDTTLDSLSVVRQGTTPFTSTESFTSASESETRELGRKIIRRYKNSLTLRPVVFALEGEMGAGKTQLVKGMAQELGIVETITSPTYTLQHEYQCVVEGQTLPFVHIDAWRLTSAQDLLDLGWKKALEDNGIIAIEWAGTQPEIIHSLAKNALVVWMKLEYASQPDTRTIALQETVKA